MATGRHERWIQAILALLLFVSYAYFLPRRVDWNQNGRMDLVFAIVDQGTLAIDDYRSNTGDYAHFGDHYYSDKAPGTSFLGVPVYWAFRTVARLPVIGDLLERIAAGAAPGPESPQEGAGLFPWRGYFALSLYVTMLGAIAFPSALLGLLVYRMARQLGAGITDAILLTTVYGLGTGAFPYGSALYGHMLTAFYLFAAFYLLHGTQTHGEMPWRLVAAGFLLGWAVITEFPMVLPAGVISLYAIYRLKDKRGLLWMVAGGVVPGAILAVYDVAIYGSPLPMGYKYSELWQEEVNTGFMTLTFPTLERLWGITLSPFRGLFFLSPALFCAAPWLLAMWRMRDWRAEWLTIVGVIVALFLFNASSVVWWGGFAVGPRYVLPAVPFLMLPIASWLRGGEWRRWIFIALGALSVFSVWAQTITSLKFYPPEQYHFPLIEYSLPLLAKGQIALNLGHAMGLQGPASLLPLVLVMLLLGGTLWWLQRRASEEAMCPAG